MFSCYYSFIFCYGFVYQWPSHKHFSFKRILPSHQRFSFICSFFLIRFRISLRYVWNINQANEQDKFSLWMRTKWRSSKGVSTVSWRHTRKHWMAPLMMLPRNTLLTGSSWGHFVLFAIHIFVPGSYLSLPWYLRWKHLKQFHLLSSLSGNRTTTKNHSSRQLNLFHVIQRTFSLWNEGRANDSLLLYFQSLKWETILYADYW